MLEKITVCIYDIYVPSHEKTCLLGFLGELIRHSMSKVIKIKTAEPGPEVIIFFSCSAQLRLNFIMLINVKMLS